MIHEESAGLEACIRNRPANPMDGTTAIMVSQIIAPMSRSTALDDLTDSADLVFERSNNITSVQISISTESQTAKELRAMKEMMANLQKQLHEMKVTRRPRSRDRMHTRHRRPRTPSNQRTNDPEICWYHQTFGDRAKKKCKPHCKFPSASEN